MRNFFSIKYLAYALHWFKGNSVVTTWGWSWNFLRLRPPWIDWLGRRASLELNQPRTARSEAEDINIGSFGRGRLLPPARPPRRLNTRQLTFLLLSRPQNKYVWVSLVDCDASVKIVEGVKWCFALEWNYLETKESMTFCQGTDFGFTLNDYCSQSYEHQASINGVCFYDNFLFGL